MLTFLPYGNVYFYFEMYQLCMHHKCYYDLYLFCSTWFHVNITILSCVNLCKSCFFEHKLCSGPLQQSPIELRICVIKGLKGTKLQCFLTLMPSTLTRYLIPLSWMCTVCSVCDLYHSKTYGYITEWRKKHNKQRKSSCVIGGGLPWWLSW